MSRAPTGSSRMQRTVRAEVIGRLGITGSAGRTNLHEADISSRTQRGNPRPKTREHVPAHWSIATEGIIVPRRHDGTSVRGMEGTCGEEESTVSPLPAVKIGSVPLPHHPS